MKAYFINLDRVPERADFMMGQLRASGFTDIMRFSAIDASKGLPANGYAPRKWGEYWTMRPSEIGVFESHRHLWQEVANAGEPAVIFEDDALISQSAGQIVDQLFEAASAYDLIKLDGVGEVIRLGTQTNIGGLAIRDLRQVVPSAAGYIVSPRGAADLLRRSRRYCDHLDDFITRPAPRYRAVQLMTAIAVQGMFADCSRLRDLPSSIAASERTTGKHSVEDYDRGPLLYRLGKEFRRSGRKIWRKAISDRRLLQKGGWLGTVPLAHDLPPYA